MSFATEGGELEALRGIDLEVFSGEVLAIVGESGSGKSVTSKALLGILPRNARIVSGEILYEGRDILGLSRAELEALRGAKISLVPQDPFLSLDPIARVGVQIAEAVRTEGVARGMAREYRRRRATELMREVGIPDAEERYSDFPFRFSGGMRQRIAIAAALAHDPEILILDEPTTALDVTIEAQILDLLDGLKRERGLSMIFITHDLGVVARIADRVAVMYAGKIVETGRVEEVFYNPRHPYTWALMSSIPEAGEKTLRAIPGTVPDMRYPPRGDAFAPRSEWAMKIDYLLPPPTFRLSPTHTVASWLYHEYAPRVDIPEHLMRRIERRGGKADDK